MQRKLELKPWITRGVFTAIKHKQKIYKSLFLTVSSEQKCYYKHYANKLNKVKFIFRQFYYQNELEKHKKNALKTW